MVVSPLIRATNQNEIKDNKPIPALPKIFQLEKLVHQWAQSYTIVHYSGFLEWLVIFSEHNSNTSESKFIWPFGDNVINWLSMKDVLEVVAAVVADPNNPLYKDQTVWIAGTSMTNKERFVDALSKSTDTTISSPPVPDNEHGLQPHNILTHLKKEISKREKVKKFSKQSLEALTSMSLPSVASVSDMFSCSVADVVLESVEEWVDSHSHSFI